MPQSFKIYKEVVEAKSRTLTFSWSFEIDPKVQVFRGLNQFDAGYYIPYKSTRISVWHFGLWALTHRNAYEIKKAIDAEALLELKRL